MADDTTRRVRPGSRRPIGGGGWTERQTGGVPPQNGTDTLAALDIGTNSVHGVVARVSPGEAGFSFDVLERETVVVRLGSRGGDMRQLADDAIDRAVAALARFRQLAAAHRPPVRAVAPSPPRDADTRPVVTAPAPPGPRD